MCTYWVKTYNHRKRLVRTTRVGHSIIKYSLFICPLLWSSGNLVKFCNFYQHHVHGSISTSSSVMKMFMEIICVTTYTSINLSCLVLSCLVLSCLVLSCLVLSCLVLSCLVLSCLVLSCLVLSCLVLSCLVLLVYWSTLLVGSNGQGWVRMLVGLLFMYQILSKMLWFRNVKCGREFQYLIVRGKYENYSTSYCRG